MKSSAYTLIELIIAITLLIIIVAGGTSLFVSNLRSGGISEVILKTSRSGRGLADLIESKIRFADIYQIGDHNREACLGAGEAGVSGSSALFLNLEGEMEELAFSDGKIASAAAGGAATRLSSEDVTVKDFSLRWFCVSGINDKIKIELVLGGSGIGVSQEVEEKVSREMVLLNSGKK